MIRAVTLAFGLLLASSAGAASDHPRESLARSQCQGPLGKGSDAFQGALEKLLDVNRWGALIGPGFHFKLHDPSGVEVMEARPGDFIKIDAPGDPRSYWVRIEEIFVAPTVARILVRPSHDPLRRPARPEVIAHFFASAATNEFSLVQAGEVVMAQVHGRGEFANRTQADSASEAALNWITARALWGIGTTEEQAGYGPQKVMWDRFTQQLADCSPAAGASGQEP
jgi:hypothetical protein